MKKIGLIIIFTFILAFIIYQITSTDMSHVKSIYVYHRSGSSIRHSEYKLDLKEKKFYIFEIDSQMRNELSENEGYQKVIDIESEKLEKFISQCEKYKFLNWKSSYIKFNVMDGHEWGMVISFDDGQKKEIQGSNKYPLTWNKMFTAFEDLTGEKVLLSKKSWTENF